MRSAKRPKPRSILSIDVGSRRIGLAGCDPLGITVSILRPIKRSNFELDLNKIQLVCKERNVKGLVIGIPLDDSGLLTKQAIFIMNYGTKLAEAVNLPIAWVNEHSTTWAAANQHNLHNDRTGKLDSASAGLILEQWLKEGPELMPVKAASYNLKNVSCNTGS